MSGTERKLGVLPLAELVPAEELADRVAAASVIPYPPGIPLLMSGEKFGPEQLKYLRLLSDWDRHFPGFEHDVEGSQVIDGSYFFWCVAK